MKFWDISSLGNYATYVALAVAALIIRWVARHWNLTKKPAEPMLAKSKREVARFLSAFILALAIGFGLLLLLAISLQPASSQSRTVFLLACGDAALAFIGALLLVVGVPVYDYVSRLEERNEVLEARLKVLEVKVQAHAEQLEEQLPVQPRFAFMDDTRDDYTS